MNGLILFYVLAPYYLNHNVPEQFHKAVVGLKAHHSLCFTISVYKVDTVAAPHFEGKCL